MSAQSILIVASQLLLFPLVLLSRTLIGFKITGLSHDLQRCLETVDATATLPARLVATLVAAEDHRSAFHAGVDPVSLLRVVFLWLRTGRPEGASTIEQQFVRVVTARYERTLYRKLREQLLAVALCQRRSKTRVAMAYLSIAYYGSRQVGLSALLAALGPNLELATQDDVSRMIARLKYPEPLLPTTLWRNRIEHRTQYIAARLRGLADRSVKPTRSGLRPPRAAYFKR
jgi:monofunctional glycosyltransferase